MIDLNSANTTGQYGHCTQHTQQIANQSSISQAKGLLNLPGSNNCFLNSAVQVLWHLDHFRNSIDLFSGHYCTSATTACVFCSLSQLFGQLKHSTRNALNADQLRRALAHTFHAQRRFQLGLMDDAIECFEHILQRLHFHCVHTQVKEEECNAHHCLSHGLFSMRLIERRFCTHCGKVEARTPYNQYVQYVSTPALIEKAAAFQNNPNIKLSFGSMVRLVSTQGEIRDCSVVSCGSRVQLRKTLLNAPKVLALGLNFGYYENERPSIDQIAKAFNLIDTFIRLSDVFEIDAQNLTLNSGESNCDVLHLVGLVTYYGKHYCTFFYNTQLATWLYLDDANVREIGNCWSYVVDKCIKASFQPLMLLYSSASNSNSINTMQAPKAVYQVPNNLKNQLNNLNGLNSSINNRRSTSHLSQLVLTNLSSTNLSAINRSSSMTTNSNTSSECEIPDSPFATKSSTSSAYFSDHYYSTGEQEFVLNSKRNLQTILTQQVATNNSVNNSHPNHHSNLHHSSHFPATTNYSSSNQHNQQRNSSSSLSDSFLANDKPPNVPSNKPTSFRKDKELPKSSDAGYDSHSLSSSDSYPSIGGSVGIGSTTSSGCSSSNSNGTNKSNLRSIQEQSTENLLASQNSNSVLADSQIFELINEDNSSSSQDSDKLINRLCSQSDILLLRSHEKERENDIKAAVVLSEAAAQKARAAMDVPITNPNSHLLISAKMKHSIAVMRSASLMRRIKELEEGEKKMIRNSLRLSRDSLISHQRRASQERLDDNNLKKMKQPKATAVQQLYGTLPKKQSNKIMQPPATPVKQIVSPPNQIPVNLSEQVVTKIKSTNTVANEINKSKANKLNRNASTCSTSSIQSTISTASKDQETSDQYAEIGEVNGGKPDATKSKQHKIRKKLLIGNFIKRKNRSLPDLTVRDNEKPVDEVDCPTTISSSNEPTNNVPDKQIIAKVSRKGFHQVHPQIYDQSTKLISKELSNKLNQIVIAPKSPKPATPVKPTTINTTKSIDQVDSQINKVDSAPIIKTENENEPEIDLSSLPPPPIEFLNDLRANKEQMNNQINENIDNEIKEKANRSTAVRNLATKFEQINVSSNQQHLSSRPQSSQQNNQSNQQHLSNQTRKPPLPPIIKKSILTEQSLNKINNAIRTSPINQQANNISPNCPIAKQQSSTGLRVAVLGSRNQSSPTLIYKNPHSTSPRPDRPPDYDTTIKRLNLIQQHSRPSIESNYSLVSLPSSLNSSLDSPFKNTNSSHNNSTLPAHQVQQLKQQQYNVAIAVRKNKICKKSVSFSDEVIIVAHPEDQQEVHLANPIFDRVLKSATNQANS